MLFFVLMNAAVYVWRWERQTWRESGFLEKYEFCSGYCTLSRKSKYNNTVHKSSSFLQKQKKNLKKLCWSQTRSHMDYAWLSEKNFTPKEIAVIPKQFKWNKNKVKRPFRNPNSNLLISLCEHHWGQYRAEILCKVKFNSLNNFRHFFQNFTHHLV